MFLIEFRSLGVLFIFVIILFFRQNDFFARANVSSLLLFSIFPYLCYPSTDDTLKWRHRTKISTLSIRHTHRISQCLYVWVYLGGLVLKMKMEKNVPNFIYRLENCFWWDFVLFHSFRQRAEMFSLRSLYLSVHSAFIVAEKLYV